MVGVGFTWNLFDGLEREKRIRQSKLTSQTLALGQAKAKDDLAIGVDKLYSQMQQAQDNVRALNTTIELSEEVARLAAYYEYDVALMNLLALCGTPEQFSRYASTIPTSLPLPEDMK